VCLAFVRLCLLGLYHTLAVVNRTQDNPNIAVSTISKIDTVLSLSRNTDRSNEHSTIWFVSQALANIVWDDR
jgi:hypothetical protein